MNYKNKLKNKSRNKFYCTVTCQGNLQIVFKFWNYSSDIMKENDVITKLKGKRNIKISIHWLSRN